MFTNALTRLFACGFAISAASISQAARATTVYDAVKQFSIKSNPAGVWSYLSEGYDMRLPLHYRQYQGIKKLYYWTDKSEGVNLPIIIMKNATGNSVTIDNGDVTLPTDHLMLDATYSKAEANVLFKAPTAGSYTIKGDFLSLSPDGGTHQWGVVKNYSTGLAGGLIGNGRMHRFNINVQLAAGDTIEFYSNTTNKDKPIQTGLKVKITGP